MSAEAWNLIETAPKTGEPLLGFVPTHNGGGNGIVIMFWSQREWRNSRGFVTHPTHWMQLPAPPEVGTRDVGGDL